MNSRKALEGFYAAIEARDVLEVERLLKSMPGQQQRAANQPYLSEFPLSVAISHADVDMAALLLVAGADPEKSLPDISSPRLQASQVAVQTTSKRAKDVGRILQLMDSPDAAKEHYVDARERARRRAAHKRLRYRQAALVCWFAILMPTLLLYLAHKFSHYSP